MYCRCVLFASGLPTLALSQPLNVPFRWTSGQSGQVLHLRPLLLKGFQRIFVPFTDPQRSTPAWMIVLQLHIFLSYAFGIWRGDLSLQGGTSFINGSVNYERFIFISTCCAEIPWKQRNFYVLRTMGREHRNTVLRLLFILICRTNRYSILYKFDCKLFPYLHSFFLCISS